MSPIQAEIQHQTYILVGGIFTNIGGKARNRIARLNTDGSADATFNPDADRDVQSIAVQADGKILVSCSGSFTSINSQAMRYLARLNPDGTLDTTFASRLNGLVDHIVLQADGKILVGGDFSVEPLTGQWMNLIGRLNADGSADATFNPDANSDVQSIAVQADGQILVGGWVTAIGGQTRSYLARLNTDGSADATFNPDANSDVQSIANDQFGSPRF